MFDVCMYSITTVMHANYATKKKHPSIQNSATSQLHAVVQAG